MPEANASPNRLRHEALRGIVPFLGLITLLAPALVRAESKPDTFVYAITGDVDSLDPDWAFDGISQEIQYQVYETLIFYRGGSVDAFEPMIASVVPDARNGNLSEDGLRYAFPIQKKVKFHDGRALTPEDVKYSLMRFMLTDRAGGPSYLLLEPLLGISRVPLKDGKPDPNVYRLADEAITVEGNAVVLRLPKPYAPLLSILATYAPMLSKQWVVANGGWDGRLETWPKFFNGPKERSPLFDKENGTGPFSLERWDKENKLLVLARNEAYWRAPAKLRRLVFRTVNDSAARRLMLKAGDADAAMLERDSLPQVQGLEDVSVTDDLALLETHNVFVMNLKLNAEGNAYAGSGKLDGDGIPADFFGDVAVRRGLAHAFDYDAYIRDGYRGKAERARGPIPKGVFGYNPRQAVYEFDLGKAAEEFKKAFGGKVWEKGFRFTLTYAEGFADRLLACQILKRNVEALNPNFHVEIKGVQLSTWLSQYTLRLVPMANARWQLDFPDADSPVYAFLHSAGYYAANSGYSNPRADRFIEEARRELDRDRRRAAYYELQAFAYQDVPQIYTVDTYQLRVSRSAVKGWYYNPIIPYGYFYPVWKGS